ncbi:MAG: hypothetical protein Q7V56_06210 [Gammaproteobacteria bacterium]|nr:hypothetical protein [Gammaproteobacteria bacterium]
MRILPDICRTFIPRSLLLLWALVGDAALAAEADVEAKIDTEAEAGAEVAATTDPTRMWLPESAANLHPFLKLAVAEALRDTTCTEVLYARLNEYRTIYEEPTFTILCKKDYKSTFNKVYHITELDPEYNSRIAQNEATSQLTQGLTAEIESLRQQLVTPEKPSEPTATVELVVPKDEDPNDLSLDLDIEPNAQ